MDKRNNGYTEQEVLQNEFTAFITIAARRERIAFLKREARRSKHTYAMSDEELSFIPDSSDFVLELCETDALACALKQLNERERDILFARVLEKKALKKLRIKYKGLTTLYYRIIRKLRNILGGM